MRMFKSFLQAGFDCTTAINIHGKRLDQISATQHDRFVKEDYVRLKQIGIHTIREGMRWNLIDQKGKYDFSSFEPFVRAARSTKMQLIVDLFHFGYPDEVDLFSDDFPDRFAEYCYAAAKFICSELPGPYFFTPLNEPSYFSWAAGEAGLFAPHRKGEGWPLKLFLVRAAIAGIRAIRSICPEARMVNADSFCRVVAPPDRPDLAEDVRNFNQGAVYQSWDMLSGNLLPELGGNRKLLDIVGINYYWTNQWQIDQVGVPLAEDDHRKAPLCDLVCEVWNRYGADVMISETGHVNDMREKWFRQLLLDSETLFNRGVRLAGICLYPALSLAEWHLPDIWTHMGLWDLVPENGELKRDAHLPLLNAIREAGHHKYQPAVA